MLNLKTTFPARMTFSKTRQVQATRALQCLYQPALADRAGVDVNTVRNLSFTSADAVGGRIETRRKVQAAAVRSGTAILNHGQPGVRLRKLGGEGES